MKKTISIILLLTISIISLTSCGNSNKCGMCLGSGYYQKKTCPMCNGSGHSSYDPYEQYENIGK